MIKIISGNEAAAYGAMLSRPQVIAAYPITPQSRIPEQLSEFVAQGVLKAVYKNMEAEVGVIGYLCGASAGGVRTFTATSGPGLLVMHEHLHTIAGSRLPVVMAVVNRTGGPTEVALSDTLSQRDTGWMQFYCESNQEVLDTIIQAYRVSEWVKLPSMVIQEGIYLSYLYEATDIPDQEKVDSYLPPYKPEFIVSPRIVSPRRGIDRMTERYQMQKLLDSCVDIVLRANEEFEAIFGRGYLPVEEYKCDDADVVVVLQGSPVGTGRYVIDRMRENGHKIGLAKLKMFRPFPKELIRKVLGGRKKIAIIERDISSGQCGIFHQEIKWALNMPKVEGIPIYGFVSGLGGADISPQLIEKAILFTMQNDPPEQDVIWLGIGKKETSDDYDRSTVQIH